MGSAPICCLAIGALLLVLPASSVRADTWPAGWYQEPPLSLQPSSEDAQAYRDLDAAPYAWWWDVASPQDVLSIAIIRGYQLFLSPRRAGICPLQPSCSRYGLKAIVSYGAVWGWLMTLDRMFYRENASLFADSLQVERHGFPWPYDPPHYDYLWSEVSWPLHDELPEN